MKTFLKVFVSLVVILSALLWTIYEYSQPEAEDIYIAFIGPMSGNDAAGIMMTQAIELYLDEVNSQGGILNGKKIKLKKFDDKNDCQGQAKDEAMKIVKENEALAVIGHWYSACSIVGGQVYKKHGIPAITPGSVAVKVTQGNEWYFRNIYNASSSSQFLAHYVKNVLQLNQVTLIDNRSDYSSYLAETFESLARELNMEITYQWDFVAKDKNLKGIFGEIVEQLKQDQKQAGAILLVVEANEAVKLVKLIKDAGIQNSMVGGSTLAEDTFKNGFDDFPKENVNSGYYTNDIYVATPLIFDTANQKAQEFKSKYKEKYDEEPDWSAAYAYDTAMVLVEAMKRAKIAGTQLSRQTDRQKIRQVLSELTDIHEAIEGTTGFNYFDKNRDSQKPPMVGRYKNKKIISTFTQSQTLRDFSEVPNPDKALEEGRVWKINDKYMYKTNVVYTGIEVKEISDIDMSNLTYSLDFYLWFRFRGDFEPQDIEFINAVEPDELTTQLETPIDKIKTTHGSYYLYHVKGRFKADFLSQNDNRSFGEHLLSVHFHHRKLNRKNLIYVPDFRGMGITEQQELLDRFKETQVINPASGWQVKQIRFFRDLIEKLSLGNPDYLNVQNGKVKYSLFNMIITVKRELHKQLEFTTVVKMWLIHLAFWIVLILVYPYSPQVQAIFFWNPYVRRIMGLGYVNFALTWVPYFRRKLLKPFEVPLLADAALSHFGQEAYFENAEVKRKGSPKTLAIKTAIPRIQGQVIVEGESGLGKTMALRYLLTTSNKKRLVVFLPAEKCTKGIMPAIQAKLHGMAKDETFLQSLVYSGALDICIDGLNQVSPDTRAKITEFVESYFRGNIIITTQPIEWTAPVNAEIYSLQPLKPDQIETFLVSRYDILPEESTLSYFDYEQKCQTYLAHTLKDDQPTEVLESIRRTLSNPMELTIIAQMLAHGQQPDFFNLQEQHYEMVAADFDRTHINRQFRLLEFSDHVYQMRVSDQAELPKKKFFDEIRSLEKYRMVVSRQSDDADGNPVKEWYFRHDKIMEFFLVKTFYHDNHYNQERITNHFHDARFRGVYFRLAMLLPLEEAIALRNELMEYATKSNDHSVFDTFVQILSSREKTIAQLSKK